MDKFQCLHYAIMIHKSPLGKQIRRSLAMGLLAVGLLFGCDNANFIRPKLSATPVLVGSNDFGVIKVSYAKGFAETKLDSMILGIHRGGDIVAIIKRSLAQEKLGGVLDYWYQVKAGEQLSWIFGAWMDQYPLEMQARTASAIVREHTFPMSFSGINPKPTKP